MAHILSALVSVIISVTVTLGSMHVEIKEMKNVKSRYCLRCDIYINPTDITAGVRRHDSVDSVGTI
jgi:hypothetical protein